MGIEAMRLFTDIRKDRRGATAVEYAIILAMVFLAIATAVSAVGVTTAGIWNNVADAWPDA
ncbi:Flp family type IVb pilin [Sphingosinicella sp. LHD-64]|uniref:Flp family type IVb pilin n=1 Tax=Sphingosinicella sp. LHD-64 TaxID=3072139 RepID=UPI0028100564|nr:Flp family type IVb pilin [Sphingosinicella sp. LHD-64]MDQ8754886.1 Flp family type IVb pilin [Sphingosinicella sp. LHD-64]